jgi:hypothetical protein
VWPPWGPGSDFLNIISFIGGIGVLLYAIGVSLSDVEVEDEARKAMKMRERAAMLGEHISEGSSQFTGNLIMGSPHFGVAIALLVMSIINWTAIFGALHVGLVIAPIGMVMAVPPSLGRFKEFLKKKEEGGILLDGIVALIILLLFIMLVVHFGGNFQSVASAWSKFWGSGP